MLHNTSGEVNHSDSEVAFYLKSSVNSELVVFFLAELFNCKFVGSELVVLQV